ncbi:MAG: hypothetical protein RI897_3280 [Verrucomicrobiota bacterium]
MNFPFTPFRYCPRCGHPANTPTTQPLFQCRHCSFRLFFNPAVSGGAFLSNPQGQILFIVRAKEPAKGKLGLPGGFTDYHENAEAGLIREIKEEVGLHVTQLDYLCSLVNYYDYDDITQPVVDLFFTGQLPDNTQPQCLDDVADIAWLHPSEVDRNRIAFPSVRAALDLLASRQ